jgi:hypothetical protein
VAVVIVRRVLAALTIVAVFGATTHVASAQAPVPEEDAKAAFLYNFAKFVDWPDDAFAAANEPFLVGVVGDDAFAAVLDRVLHGKVVRDRPLAVRRIARPDDLAGCHVVFVGDGRLPEVFQAVASRPILTVGQRDDFATKGGMIGFLVQDQKLRFEVNLDAAERANLRISSQLLKLATRVIRHEG